MGRKEKLIRKLKSPPKGTARVSDQATARKIGIGGTNMKNTMEYKGYVGSVEFSEADRILFGKVQGIRSLISYEGTTVSELLDDFHGAVDDYLAACEAEGRKPEQAFKGSFNVRFKAPDLHREAAVYAYNHNMSLNSLVEESVTEYLVHNNNN